MLSSVTEVQLSLVFELLVVFFVVAAVVVELAVAVFVDADYNHKPGLRGFAFYVVVVVAVGDVVAAVVVVGNYVFLVVVLEVLDFLVVLHIKKVG